MSVRSENSKTERDTDSKNYFMKMSRKQELIRPSSIIPSSRNSGRHHRAASVSTTSYLLEKNALEKQNADSNILKNSDVELRQVRGRKTRRANSLPTCDPGKYAIKGHVKQSKHTENSKKTQSKRKDVDCKRVYRQRMSLDLSQMSDYADSEGEGKDKFSKHHSRRRRSTEKMGRIERVSSQLAVRSMSNSPSSKVTSSTHQTITRRSSLQNFSPRSYASFETVPQNNVDNRDFFRNQNIRRRTSSALFIRKASLGSSLMRNSELNFSSESPDYTTDPSPSEVSPQKKKSVKKFGHNIGTLNAGGKNSLSKRFNDDKFKNTSAATPGKERGEWNSFWQNYNSSLAALPKKFFYDDCPTPFYEPKINGDIKAFEMNYKPPELPKERDKIRKSKDSEMNGIFLSNSEAKEIIQCAQKLAEILSSALEGKTGAKDAKPDIEEEIENESKIVSGDKRKRENKTMAVDNSKDVFL